MTTRRMTAHAPASPIRLAGMRESADEVVIRPLTLHGVRGLVKSAALAPVRSMSHTGGRPSRDDAVQAGRRGPWDAGRPAGFFRSRARGESALKPENLVDGARATGKARNLDAAHTERRQVDFRVRRAHSTALVGLPLRRRRLAHKAELLSPRGSS